MVLFSVSADGSRVRPGGPAGALRSRSRLRQYHASQGENTRRNLQKHAVFTPAV